MTWFDAALFGVRKIINGITALPERSGVVFTSPLVATDDGGADVTRISISEQGLQAAPVGAAGGDLAGNYPNPTANPAKIALATRKVIAGNGLTGGGDLLQDRTVAVKAGDGSVNVGPGGITVPHVALTTGNPHNVTAANVGCPPNARTISSGNGLSGGGDLSADRTLTVLAEDSSIVVGAGGIKVADAIATFGKAVFSKVVQIDATSVVVGPGSWTTYLSQVSPSSMSSGETYLVMASISGRLEGSTDKDMLWRVAVAGVTNGVVLRESFHVDDVDQNCPRTFVSLFLHGAGSSTPTFTIEFAKSGGGGTVIAHMRYATLVVFRIG